MYRRLKGSKSYVFVVSFDRYVTHLFFKATRLSQALCGLEFFFDDLNIPGIKLNLSRSYKVFTEYEGIIGKVRTYTLKSLRSELTTCYTLCSPSIFSSDNLQAIFPHKFIRVLRDLDEQETRPENLLSEGSWYVDEHY